VKRKDRYKEIAWSSPFVFCQHIFCFVSFSFFFSEVAVINKRKVRMDRVPDKEEYWCGKIKFLSPDYPVFLFDAFNGCPDWDMRLVIR